MFRSVCHLFVEAYAKPHGTIAILKIRATDAATTIPTCLIIPNQLHTSLPSPLLILFLSPFPAKVWNYSWPPFILGTCFSCGRGRLFLTENTQFALRLTLSNTEEIILFFHSYITDYPPPLPIVLSCWFRKLKKIDGGSWDHLSAGTPMEPHKSRSWSNVIRRGPPETKSTLWCIMGK